MIVWNVYENVYLANYQNNIIFTVKNEHSYQYAILYPLQKIVMYRCNRILHGILANLIDLKVC